jgi:putative ABC transport system permease protein
MEIQPILNALVRNRSGALLIAIQIALTLAVVVNAFFIINQKLSRMDRPVGIDRDNIFTVRTTSINTLGNREAFLKADMQVLRAIPGVINATPVLTIPQGGSTRVDGYHAQQGNVDFAQLVNINYIDHHGFEALGLKIIAGRNFTQEEITYVGRNDDTIPTKIILTLDYANRLFPEGNAAGKNLYYGDNDIPIKIIGIVENMAAGWLGADDARVNDKMNDMVFHPFITYGNSAWYLIRTESGMQNDVMLEVEDALVKRYPDRLVDNLRSQNDLLSRVYAGDKALAIILTSVIILLIGITSLGVVGLANSSVSQRHKQIGTRRALGAQKADVVSYFLVENMLITGTGVVVGVFLAYGFNYWLVTEFAQPKLQGYYVHLSILLLFLLGQVAVLMPALKASNISPAVATRSI